MAAHKTFSNEQANFILQNYRGKTNTEICDLLNQKFCTNFRPKQVEHFKYTNHLYSLKKKFPPEICCYIAENHFGKFHKELTNEINTIFGTSYATKEVTSYLRRNHLTTGMRGACSLKYSNGETVLRKAGLFIKVDGQFIKMSHYVLEQNGIKVKPGDCIKFLDGNKTNYDPENLAVVSRNENLRLNSNGWFTNNKFLNQCAIDTIRLQTAVNQIEKSDNH